MAKIVPVEELQPAFEHAMTNIMRSDDKTHTIGHMMAAWKKHYDCYLLHDKEFGWESVGFKNEEQQLMFMLKWS